MSLSEEAEGNEEVSVAHRYSSSRGPPSLLLSLGGRLRFSRLLEREEPDADESTDEAEVDRAVERVDSTDCSETSEESSEESPRPSA